jgi:peroxiredoxin
MKMPPALSPNGIPVALRFGPVVRSTMIHPSLDYDCWYVAALSDGDRFPNLRLESDQGTVDLRDRWSRSVLIVTFMRHFGCSFCREHLSKLSRADDRIRAAGAETIAIFQYEAEATKAHCEGRGVPFDCLGDPLHEAYAQVELGKGNLRQMAGWRVMKKARSAYRAGGGLGKPQGISVMQMPGTFVIGRDGRVLLPYYSETAADNPSVETQLAAIPASEMVRAGPASQ